MLKRHLAAKNHARVPAPPKTPVRLPKTPPRLSKSLQDNSVSLQELSRRWFLRAQALSSALEPPQAAGWRTSSLKVTNVSHSECLASGRQGACKAPQEPGWRPLRLRRRGSARDSSHREPGTGGIGECLTVWLHVLTASEPWTRSARHSPLWPPQSS